MIRHLLWARSCHNQHKQVGNGYVKKIIILERPQFPNLPGTSLREVFLPNPFLSPTMGLAIRMTRAVGLPPRPPLAPLPPTGLPPWAAAGRCYSPPPRGLKPGIHWPQVASTEKICSLTKPGIALSS